LTAYTALDVHEIGLPEMSAIDPLVNDPAMVPLPSSEKVPPVMQPVPSEAQAASE
jgi:hypothetical protein